MGHDALDLALSAATLVAQGVYFAVDRPRAIARHPERAGRVDAVGIWVLRALVFGPLAIPFYLGRARGWRAAVLGIVVVAAILGALQLVAG